MHLVLIINSLGIGGAEKVLIRLAEYWAANGHQISFVTFFQEEKFFYKFNQMNNINLVNLNEQTKSFNVFKIIKRIYLLRNFFNNIQPTLMLSFLVGANITVLLASLGIKFPVIVSERIDPSKHNISIFYKLLRIFSYNFAKTIIVQTKGIAEYFPNSWQGKIAIIPNWVKNPIIKKNLDYYKNQKIKKIITVGRLDPQKDQQTLIKAFAKLTNNYPEITLTIYGEGILRGALTNLINTLNLQHKVFLPGIVLDLELEKAFMDADLFVFPSIYEGFSNALAEAMSYGLPVIASRCSGNIDMVVDGENGLLFTCGDIEELVAKINVLLNNQDYCYKLALKARDIVNQFNQTNILKQWDNVLKSVVLK